jgi:aminopeptidase
VADAYLAKLAEVLVNYSTSVQEGDVVLIESPVIAAPLVREVYRRVVRAGGRPLLRLSLETMIDTLLRYGSDEQLEWVNPVRADDFEHADVRIVLLASSNTKGLTSVDPSRQALYGRAHEQLGNRYLKRAAAGELRWTLTQFPTHAAAQDAEMSLEQYERFVYRAGLLDERDPIGSWRAFSEYVAGVARFLGTKSELRIVAEGTDLRLGVGGRTWVPAGGRENFPDGETFTGPVEDSVEGTIRFTFPAVFQGREVDDVRLRFEGGEVVEATAAQGQDFLEQMIAMDDGARRVGEFAFGLNEGIAQYTKNTLFDEKIGGTCHLALGTAYPETGGKNRSGLHWDMVCDLRKGSEVYADGELVYRNGKFLRDMTGV